MPLADRTRLAARVPADYPGFGYAPILPDDMNAVVNIGNDIASASPNLDANNALIAADVAATRVERIAASTSASAAAGMVTATVDRAAGRLLNDVDLWSVVRATPSWNFGPDGGLVEVPADGLAWDFDQVTGSPLGVAFAGQRTNRIRNPRAEGAVAGTPGTWPTNWLSNGAPGSVAGSGAEGGIPYFEHRFNSGFTSTFSAILDTTVAASAGQVWTGSYFVRLVAGTLANVSFTQMTVAFFDGVGGTGTNLANNVINFTPSGSALSTQRRLGTFTAPAGTQSVQLRFRYVTSGAHDFTLRIGSPQLEQAASASSPILPPIGAPGVSTRAQGTVDIPVWRLGNRWNRRQGVLVVEWNSRPGPFSSVNSLDEFGLMSLGNTTSNEVAGIVINQAHDIMEFRRVVGGAAQTAAACTLTAPAAGQTIRCAFAWDIDAGLMQAAARGAVGSQLTGQTLIPIITHLMPGRFSTTRPLFGGITGAEIRPAAVFGATLAAMT